MKKHINKIFVIVVVTFVMMVVGSVPAFAEQDYKVICIKGKYVYLEGNGYRSWYADYEGLPIEFTYFQASYTKATIENPDTIVVILVDPDHDSMALEMVQAYLKDIMKLESAPVQHQKLDNETLFGFLGN